MRPGIYPDLGITDYHRPIGYSKTSLALLAESPRTYRHAMEQRNDKVAGVNLTEGTEEASAAPTNPNRSLRLGNALHAAMEGTFEQIYAVGPAAVRNTKVWKEFEAQNKHRICLKPDEAEPVLAMRDAIRAYAPAREILEQPGRYEVSFYWEDLVTGLLLKCRPDWISADLKTVVDFKTARNVSHDKFQKAAYDLHYFVSAALTLDGIYQTTGIKPDRYVFICVHTKAPHLVAAYVATAEEIELGRDFVRTNLSLLKTCLDTDQWPGLPEEIRPLGLPRFAKRGELSHVESDDDDLIEELENDFNDAIAAG